MRIRKIWRNGSEWKKRNIWSVSPFYGETKPKNKQNKEKEETIEKYRLSQERMNNYKKEVKDREKNLIWERYKEQKIKVRELIKKEIRKHKGKIVEEIIQD